MPKHGGLTLSIKAADIHALVCRGRESGYGCLQLMSHAWYISIMKTVLHQNERDPEYSLDTAQARQEAVPWSGQTENERLPKSATFLMLNW